MKKSEETKKRILEAGVKLWPNVTARGIARNLKPKMTHPTIVYHFGEELVDAVALHAVTTGNSRVIAQLIATKHKAVKGMTLAERAKHMKAAS